MTAAGGRIRSGSPARRAAGFTYVGLIILVAIIGLVAATTLRVGVTMQRAQAERDLLHIGEQFSDALKSYAAATPAGQPQQPPTLKELLKDPRYPGIRRHLRKIFVDPMTGKADWGVLYIADNKGVLGIYSRSTAAPIKVSNFPARFQTFDGKQKISDWVFTFDGREPPPPGMLPAKAGQPGQLNQPGQTGQPGQSNQPGQIGQPGQAGQSGPGRPTGGVSTGTPPAPTPSSPMTGVPPPRDDSAEPAAPPVEPAEPAETAPAADPPAEPEPEPEPAPEPAEEPAATPGGQTNTGK